MVVDENYLLSSAIRCIKMIFLKVVLSGIAYLSFFEKNTTHIRFYLSLLINFLKKTTHIRFYLSLLINKESTSNIV